MGRALEGGDVLSFAQTDVPPHPQGLLCGGAPEVVVPDDPAQQPHPDPVKDLHVLLVDRGRGGHEQPGGLRVLAGEHGVQAVDALEDDHLLIVELDGAVLLRHLILDLEVKIGNYDLPALIQGLQVLADQRDVQALGGLQIRLAVLGLGEVRLVLGAVVVVQGDHVGEDPPIRQGLPQTGCRGGLAGGGGSRQQDDPAPAQTAHHRIGGGVDPVVVEVVALGHVGLGVGAKSGIDIIQFDSHEIRLLFS